jgi:hypothetical protein
MEASLAFEVLCAEGDEARRWTGLIDALPPGLRDIHFLPDYGRIYRATHGFEPMLAVHRADEGYVLQPFVRRPLRELPFLSGTQDRACDIANPYGYGGPLCSVAADSGIAARLYADFTAEFAAWCEAQQIASEFTSLHPFLVAHQLALLKDALAPRHEKDVIYIDLGGGEEDLARGLNRGHRSSIGKARRGGVRVEKVEPTAANLATFDEIYRTTMTRRNAEARWFVPDDFFAQVCRILGPQRTSLFFAFVGDKVETAYLLMHEFGTAYYHFAGTRAAYPELRANNFTMYETARWARRAGFTRYHLGGGVTSSKDDTLLRFKAGFSERRAPLYTYFCVRDRVVYDRLCERKRAHERASAGRESSSGFMPLYRR